MTKEKTYRFILLLIVFISAVIQSWFVVNTIDSEPDSYAHFSIARQLSSDPGNIYLHWVWLPLFHFLSALFVKAGTGITAIRFMNVVIWMLIPLFIFSYLSGKGNSEENSLKNFLISAVVSIFPLGFSIAVSGLQEPLFILLLILFVIQIENKKYLSASIVLAIMCLLRYEAYAVFGGVLFFAGINFIRKKNMKKIIPVIIIPGITIGIWAAIRYYNFGNLFGFYADTESFVKYISEGSNEYSKGIFERAINYIVIVPFRYSLLLFIPAVFALKSVFKDHLWMFISGFSILAMVSVSFIFGTNLGLPRHFTGFLPLYSTLTIYGLYKIAMKLRLKDLIKEILIISLILVNCGTMYAVWVREYIIYSKYSFNDKKNAAAYIKKLPAEAVIFCDDTMIEILSGLPINRFKVINLRDDQFTDMIIKNEIGRGKPVYIVANNRRIGFLSRYGNTDIIFSDSEKGDRIFIIKN